MGRNARSWGDPFSVYTQYDSRNCAWCDHHSEDGCTLSARLSVTQMLSRVYGNGVCLGRCEQGDSLVRRSELFLRGHTQGRGLRRCHFIERYAGERRYLGCVDVRSNDEKAPVASAFLKLPLRLLRSGSHTFPLAWYYCSYSGITPFLSTPYTMHNRARGYVCAQACVYLALLMMARHGGMVHGPTTISGLAGTAQDPDEDMGSHCPKQNSDDFVITGLTPRQVRAIADRTKLKGHYVCLHSTWVTRLVFRRLLAAYLLAGFPVILFVDINRLHQDRRRLEELQGPKGSQPPPQGPQSDHAVVAVGGGNLDDPDDAAATIVMHDTAVEPYVERPMDEALAACQAFGKEGKLGFVAYCPRSVRVTAFRILQEALAARKMDPRSDVLWRIRWSETALLGSRYFGGRKRWLPLSDTADPGAYLRQGIKGSSVWLLEFFTDEWAQRTKRPHRVVGFDAERLASGPLFVLSYSKHGDSKHVATVTKHHEARAWLALTGALESW